jgi:CBS domain-containing protein
MELITVKDLMVPLEEYATVNENATLYEAVEALEKAQELLDRTIYQYLHRAIIVLDNNNHVVGKISQLDVLRALEPKYKEMGDTRRLSLAGFSSDFIESLMARYNLCEIPFTQMCARAADMKVKDFMYTLSEGEYVGADNSLCEAIHMLVMGQHQSLLVTKEEKIIGVLRLTDVFKYAFQTMASHKIE